MDEELMSVRLPHLPAPACGTQVIVEHVMYGSIFTDHAMCAHLCTRKREGAQGGIAGILRRMVNDYKVGFAHAEVGGAHLRRCHQHAVDADRLRFQPRQKAFACFCSCGCCRRICCCCNPRYTGHQQQGNNLLHAHIMLDRKDAELMQNTIYISTSIPLYEKNLLFCYRVAFLYGRMPSKTNLCIIYNAKGKAIL